MEKCKKAVKIVLMIAAVVVFLLAGIYINHRLRLHQEAEFRTPLGQMVEVDGHHMSVYTEGRGEKTLVFLSGGGTCSPILDFKSLYSLLSGDYKIAVVEKFGYGFSDVVEKSSLCGGMAIEKVRGTEVPRTWCFPERRAQ